MDRKFAFVRGVYRGMWWGLLVGSTPAFVIGSESDNDLLMWVGIALLSVAVVLDWFDDWSK